MGSIEQRLAAMARERANVATEEKERSVQEQADQRIDELKSSIIKVGEIVEGLREVREAKKRILQKRRGHKTSFADHERILKEQLNSPDSAFKRILRDVGLDPEQFLSEQGISSVESLVAKLPQGEEAQAYLEAEKGMAESAAELNPQTEKGLGSKHQALEFLKAHPSGEPGQEQPRVPKRHNLDHGGPRTKADAAVAARAGADIPETPSGRRAITFDTLISALEARQAAFRKQYEELFPNSTEGKRQAAAKKLVSQDTEHLWRSYKNEVINFASLGRVDFLSHNVLEGEKVIGRAEVKKSFLEALGNKISGEYEEREAARLGVVNLQEVKDQIRYFDTVFEPGRNQVKAAKKAEEDLERKLRSQLSGVIDKIHETDKKWTENFQDQYSQQAGPPLFSRNLNDLLDNVGREMGVASARDMFANRGAHQSLDNTGIVGKFDVISQGVENSWGGVTAFGMEKISYSDRGIESQPIKTDIIQPGYVKQQLEAWQALLNAFYQALEEVPDKKAFLSGSRNYVAIGQINAHIPAEMRQRHLEPSYIDNQYLTMPRSVYQVFAKAGHLSNVRGIINRAVMDAQTKTQQVLEKVGVGMDAGWAKLDLRSLENGPRTRDLLRQARQVKANNEVARSFGSMSDIERSLARVANHAATIRIYDSAGTNSSQIYIEDAMARENYTNATRAIEGYQPQRDSGEQPIEGFKQKYLSRSDLIQRRDALNKKISDFESRKIRVDLTGKIAQARKDVAAMEMDLNAWDAKVQKQDQAKADLDRVGELATLLAEKVKNGLRFDSRQLEIMSKSQNVDQFLENLRAELQVLRDQQLTEPQAQVYQRWQQLQSDLKTMQEKLASNTRY